MGNPVTVDSDDLEKLIMLTGAIKQIEQIIHQRKGDPFLPKNEDAIKDAHDRLASLWRKAIHIPNPAAMEPPSDKAMALLRMLKKKGLTEIEHQSMALDNYKELTMKLLIEYGNGYDVIYWSNSGEVEKLNPVPMLMVRVTAKGCAAIAEFEALEQNIISQ